MQRWIPRTLLTVGLAWLGFMLWITLAGLRVELRKVDCIVVLGARSLADGTPGPSLRARCQHGVDLWKAGWAPVLLFTGGRGSTGSVEGVTGMRFAREQGVPQSALYYEGWSHTTRENFHYAARVMRQHGWKSCLVVTDPFHQPRSLALAADEGLTAYPAPTFEGPAWKRWPTFAFYTLRESASWCKYWWE